MPNCMTICMGPPPFFYYATSPSSDLAVAALVRPVHRRRPRGGAGARRLFSLTRTGFRRSDVCTTTGWCSGARKSSLIEYFLCSPFFLRFAQVVQRACALFFLTCRHARSAWQVSLRRHQVSLARNHHLLQHHCAQHHGAQHHPEAGAARRVGAERGVGSRGGVAQALVVAGAAVRRDAGVTGDRSHRWALTSQCGRRSRRCRPRLRARRSRRCRVRLRAVNLVRPSGRLACARHYLRGLDACCSQQCVSPLTVRLRRDRPRKPPAGIPKASKASIFSLAPQACAGTFISPKLVLLLTFRAALFTHRHPPSSEFAAPSESARYV